MNTADSHRRNRRSLTVALATLLFGSTTTLRSAPIVDDFESYSPGSFPSPVWSDVATVLPVPPPGVNAAAPSASVVATVDAFGNATQALQTAAALGVARGVYAPVPLSATYSLTAQIRTLQFADTDPQQDPTSDWSMQLTFAQAGVANFSVTPQAGLYASSATRGWRFFLISSGAGPVDDVDLALPALLGTWYSVTLDVDAVNGLFGWSIADTATGSMLGSGSILQPGWQPAFGPFDSIAFFGGETAASDPPVPGSTTVPSVAQVDNINIVTEPVPEPPAVALLLLGLAGVALRRCRNAA